MRRYLIFVSAGVGLLMASIDITVVAVAFPNLTRDLGTNILWAAWTISVYQLAVTIIMPLAGKVSDSLGRKKIFLISLILFTTSSFLCGLAPNIYFLVAFRFLQGIGGGCFLPTAAGIVSDHFPKSRQSALGLFSSIFAIGGIVGPNLGGWIVERYSWRYVFYVNVPIGIGLIVLTLILLQESEMIARPRLDLLGAYLFSGSMFSLMLGLNLTAEKFSVSSYLIAALLFIISFCLIYIFFCQEKRAPDPILDIELLSSRPFLAANLYNMIIGAAFFGIFSFVPLYAISVYKLSTFSSGMILTPRSLGIIPASMVTSFLLRRWGYRWPMVVGLSITSIAMLVLGQGVQPLGMMGIHLGSAEFLAFLIMISGIGVGITLPPSNNACIELMPERVATITGLRGMFRSIGGILGISLITIILHLSSNPVNGFKIAFTAFGLGLLFAFPLVFLMPTGKQIGFHHKGAQGLPELSTSDNS